MQNKKGLTLLGRKTMRRVEDLQAIDRLMNKNKPYSIERHYFIEMKINVLRRLSRNPKNIYK